MEIYRYWIMKSILEPSWVIGSDATLTNLFMDRLELFSEPRNLPPIHSKGHGALLTNSGVIDGNTVLSDGNHQFLESVNKSSVSHVSEMIRILDQYINSYPQCMDGLEILVWSESRETASVLDFVIEDLRKKYKSLRIRIHVLAPEKHKLDFLDVMYDESKEFDSKRILPQML